MRSLSESSHAVVDLGVVLMIGIAFVGLMIMAYVIFTVKDQLTGDYPAYATPDLATDALNASYNESWQNSYGNPINSIANVTGGFDDAINLLLVAITIFILAIAISALLLMRGR